MAELLPLKEKVRGSSPLRGTMIDTVITVFTIASIVAFLAAKSGLKCPK
jgi:hypothetical protein